MLKALLVDDEAPARDELKYLLSGYKNLEVIGEADSGPAAISQAAQMKPDVIFLDVQMRGMTGLETAVVLRAILPETLIIFATAYDEYAVKAFEVGAVDYVLKPFEGNRVVGAIERLRKYLPDEWRAAASRIDETLTKSKINVHKLPVDKRNKMHG
jgi:two-component system LytT family response regulator/two-component system response regulator LytT